MISQDLLYQLAVEHGYDGLELTRYAEEDHIGGYHWRGELSKWNVGSLFESEGQMLYALIRYLKPQLVVEIGSFHGCSTAHMALAIKANGTGEIIAVDDVRNGAFHDQFPPELQQYVEQVVSDGAAYLEKLAPESIDFVFEDSSHSEEDTYRISKAALVALKPGGLLINHDAMHDMAIDGDGNRSPVGEGAAIRAGLTRAGANFKTYIAPVIARDSDCGLAVTKKPEVKGLDTHSVQVESPMESEQFLKPSEDRLSDAQKMHHAIFGLTYRAAEKTDEELLEEVFSTKEPEPLASEEDHIKAEDYALSSEPEPLAKEDDTVILPADELPKKKRGRKPKQK